MEVVADEDCMSRAVYSPRDAPITGLLEKKSFMMLK